MPRGCHGPSRQCLHDGPGKAGDATNGEVASGTQATDGPVRFASEDGRQQRTFDYAGLSGHAGIREDLVTGDRSAGHVAAGGVDQWRVDHRAHGQPMVGRQSPVDDWVRRHGERVGLPIRKRIDRAMTREVDQYGAVNVPATQREVVHAQHRDGADLQVRQCPDQPQQWAPADRGP